MKKFVSLFLLVLVVSVKSFAAGLGDTYESFQNSLYYKQMAFSETSRKVNVNGLMSINLNSYIDGVTLEVILAGDKKITDAILTVSKEFQKSDEYQAQHVATDFMVFFSTIPAEKMAPVYRSILGNIKPTDAEYIPVTQSYLLEGMTGVFTYGECSLSIMNQTENRLIDLKLNHN